MTQDEIVEMTKQAGMTQDGDMWFSNGKGDMDVEHKHLVAFAKLVADKEREACAKVCVAIANKPSNIVLGVALDCATAIRARGEHMNAFDYKGQPSIWTKDVELKKITHGKKIGMKRREQIRKTESHIEYQCKPRKAKK